MSFVPASEAVTHELHGARFVAYLNPGTGSEELAAWRLEVAPGLTPVPHTISRAEVFLVLSGRLTVTVDGESRELSPGDACAAPAGSRLSVANADPDEPAAAWVTTSVGLEAVLADGSRVVPPWASGARRA
jgi:quercetin dioxygenase-like cupin family protein